MKKPLDILHTYLCGNTRTHGLNGEQYYILLVDDYTRMTAVFFLMNKSEVFKHFKIYKEIFETKMDIKIKYLILDNGGEFTSKEFMDFCGKIIH
jgi:hypothetical protein